MLYEDKASAVWQAIQADLCEGQPFMMACLISQDRLPEASCVLEFFEDHKASPLYLSQDLQTLVDAFKTDFVSEASKPQAPVRPSVVAANKAYAKQGTRKRRQRKGKMKTYHWHPGARYKCAAQVGDYVVSWRVLHDGKEPGYRPDKDTTAFVWRKGELVPALIG